jgi:hypothetical protein
MLKKRRAPGPGPRIAGESLGRYNKNISQQGPLLATGAVLQSEAKKNEFLCPPVSHAHAGPSRA